MTQRENVQKKFLSQLVDRARREGSKYVCITALPDRNKKQLNAVGKFFDVEDENIVNNIIQTINTLNTIEYGLFVGVNNFLNENRKKDSVNQINHVFIDMDKANEEDYEKVKNHLNGLNVKINYAGKSGNGYHILIPVRFNAEEENKVKTYLKYLKEKISNKVDTTTGDLSRVMRVPETLHHKKEPPFKLEVLELNDYSEEDIQKNSFCIDFILKGVESSENFINKCIKWSEFHDLYYNIEIPKKFYKEDEETVDRSKVEQSIVDKLAINGYQEFHEIDSIMNKCKIGRWQETHDTYKNNTFENAIKSSEKYNIQGSNNNVLNYLDKRKKEYHRLGCGIHQGIFYFGTKIENDKGFKHDAIITSDNKAYVCWKKNEDNEITNKFGISYRYELFDDAIDYSWSNESIKKWLMNQYDNISIKELFDEIIKLNEYYISHEEISSHQYVACDIIATYFLPLWDARGRTYFFADYGSGKTKQSTIYKLLSFNTLMAGNMSPASFERVIESTCGTIIIDNLDNLSDEVRKLVNQFIEVYYLKAGKTIKADGKNWKPSAYHGFSSMVINNIIGLSPVTESRCNTINMVKTDDIELSLRKIDFDEPIWHEIRDKLHICALQNWQEVQDIYDNLIVEDISHRDFEKSAPILAIAKLVSEDVFNNLVDMFKQMSVEQKDYALDEDDWEVIGLNIFVDRLGELDETKVHIDNLKEIAQKHYGVETEKIKLFSRFFGKKIKPYKNLVFKSKTNGKTVYKFTREGLEKLLKLKNLSYLLEKNSQEVGDKGLNGVNEKSYDDNNNSSCEQSKDKSNKDEQINPFRAIKEDMENGSR